MGVCIGLEDGGLQQPYAPCVFSGGKVHEAQDSDKQLFTVSAEWAMTCFNGSHPLSFYPQGCREHSGDDWARQLGTVI